MLTAFNKTILQEAKNPAGQSRTAQQLAEKRISS